jgi:uncharacterized repeat protein (TIGR02543 family)
MRKPCRAIIRKGTWKRSVSLALAAALVLVFNAVAAENPENPCKHVHSDICYIAPEGHICAVEAGCEPIYPDVVTPGHVHNDDCWISDLESGAPVLVCALEEGPDIVAPDTGAAPTGWMCGALEVVCAHGDCVFGADCVAFVSLGGPIAFGLFNPLAIFDGIDLSGGSDVKSYGHENFVSVARMLKVNAEFTSLSVNRTIEIVIKPGLMFSTLPGFSWNNSTRLWVYDNDLLPVEQRAAVTGAVWTPDTLSNPAEVLNVSSVKLRSGKVTYYINSDNVTELVLQPTVIYDAEFLLNVTSNPKTLTDSILVTTKEDGGIIESQKLETVNISGLGGIYLFCPAINTYPVAQGQTGVKVLWRIDQSYTGFQNSDYRKTTNYYIPHAEFTIHLPAGFTVDAIPIGYNATGNLDHVGVLTTVVTGDHTTGTDIRVKIDKLYIDITKNSDFWLKLSVDAATPLGTYQPIIDSYLVTPYGGIAGTEGNVSSALWLNVRNDTGLATIAKAYVYDTYGVGYVPDSQIANPYEGTMLGGFILLNDNPNPLPRQTVRIDFNNVPGEVMPREVLIPVSAVTGNKVPNVRAHTTGGDTIDVAGLDRGLRTTEAARVVFSLKDHTYATGSIDWIEYEIEGIMPEYGRGPGHYSYNFVIVTGIYGAFAETMPANVNFSVKVKSGDITTIAGDWSAPDRSLNVTVPVKAPATSFGLSGIDDGSAFKAGETYTKTILIQVPPSNMNHDVPAGTATATYAKGVDIYLRTLGSLTIDPTTIELAAGTSGVYIITPTIDPLSPVPAGNISILQDNIGYTVYKIHLPDAVLSLIGSGSEKEGGTCRVLFLRYTFAVKSEAVTKQHNLSDLIWVRALYDDGLEHGARGSDDHRAKNNFNTYDVAGDGTTGWRYGTLSNMANFVIQAQSTFMAATAAQLKVGPSAGGWQTANSEADALTLTPFGTIEYRFRAQNSSGKAVGEYTAHIPIPIAGQGAASGFKSDDPGHPARFDWTAVLSGPVVPPGGVSAVVSYSTDYEPDTDVSAGFEPWNALNAENYKTVRIVYDTLMPNGAVHDYVLPLEVFGSSGEKMLWTAAAATNFYSSSVAYKLQDSVTQTNQLSQPVAIRLSSGIVVGRVYQDNDRNGAFSAGDVGLANAQVAATITAGPTHIANGNADKLLSAVFTDSAGYYQVVLADTDVVSLVISNPAFGTKMLRFYGASSVAQTKTLTGIVASVDEAALQGGAEGLVPPHTLQWNDNRSPYGTGTNTTFAAIYRYANESIAGSHETTDALSPVPPTASAVTGYDYSRWYSNTVGTSGFEPTAWPANANATFYALRLAKNVTVNFLNNYTPTDDTHYSAAETANTGKKFGSTLSNTFTAPSRTGYTFTGWYTARTDGTQWNFATSTIQTEGTTTLYARWTATGGGDTPTYTLSFALGGSPQYPTTPASIPPVALYAGDFIVAAAGYGTPSRAGHGFGGWYMNGALTVPVTNASVMPTANQTIYAKWTLGHTVTFNGNGGTVAPGNETRPVVPPATTLGTLPSDPTWSGYVFTGWNTTSNGGGTGFTGATPVTGDITVYAQWRYGNGGEPPLPEEPLLTDPSAAPPVTPSPTTNATPAPGSTQATPQPDSHLQPGADGNIPETGDGGLPFYWPLMLLLSLVAMGVTWRQWRRRG